MRHLLLLGLLLVFTAQAVEDLTAFPDDEMRQRYHTLTEELRCPKCQNQNLADSNSMIAEDLRAEVHRLLLDGKSDQQIKQYLVARYGDFVLYKPPVKSSTWVLWLLPVALLLVAVIVILLLVRGQRKNSAHLQTPDLERLDAILSDEDGNS